MVGVGLLLASWLGNMLRSGADDVLSSPGIPLENAESCSSVLTFASSTSSPYGGSDRIVPKAPAISPLHRQLSPLRAA